MAPLSSKASSLTLRDHAYIWHPFTQMQTAPPPIPIVKGEGVYLFSEEGRSYLDGISSWWVNLHGHANPYIVKAIQTQVENLEHVIFAGFTHAPAVDLAERLLPLLPGDMSKIFYSDNGSTAVETALKMALQFGQKRGKSKVVCFRNGYHGDTFGAMSAAGKNGFNRPFWSYLFEVEVIDPPLDGQEARSLFQLKQVLEKGDVACFIYEPRVLGAGGMLIYSASSLAALIDCCREYGALTIADEVMTGFGRTGPLFASVNPDLICLSKGLTGGFLPLGATACTEEIFNAFLSDRLDKAFLHGHSYTANPLGCVSALASLDLLLLDSCAKQRKMIADSHQSFCLEWGQHPRLKRCECLGTLLVWEYKTESSSYFQPIRDRLYEFFLGHGLLLRPFGNILHLLPPYCITDLELKWIYEKISLTLEGDL